ncbi:hypothetical protein M3Y94_00292400 [Aphelenchoides besseyi]|nr:hypothetical protein M3Y94_00292400 [Aphelenchoides besseyi]KAI6235891.1 hypothetical protein M3Y95_00099400 [Aphelenchoides besseyi]
MVVPLWAWFGFGVCFALIILLILLDYLVIRRNALGNSCCAMGTRTKRGCGSQCAPSVSNTLTSDCQHYHKRSTNMVLSNMLSCSYQVNY